MKTTFKIAGTELALLFYSPIAWFLLVAFFFQAGLAYTGSVENYLISQEMGGRNLEYLTFLTDKIFTMPYATWYGLVENLYLYLPLLTMGLMSREINSGTIKLLYSSPIKIREIIFGKFLAMMVYNLALVVILAVIVCCALFNIRHADSGLLFSGLFGIYLLLCAYAAIGLFMSCLTSYQVVAALSTLVLLGALSYIGKLWQGVDFVRDLTYFLSITGRADHMLKGLISTKDILYFCVIMFIFLSFSIYKLRSDRESTPVWIKASRYVLIFAGSLALGYITSRPGLIGYFDATANKSLTLTANSQKIIKETGDTPIEVTAYTNLLDNFFWLGRPEGRIRYLEVWEPYLRFKPNIRFKYVYYYDSTADRQLFKYNPGMTLKSLAEKYARSMKLDMNMFKTPAEIRKMIDLRPEQDRFVMRLSYEGRTTFLRVFNDQIVWPTETEIDAALKRLMQARMPKIAFVQGESERGPDKMGDRQYKLLTNSITFRYSLINQGFDVETISLQNENIPTDITALVIADPKVSFDTASLRKIRQYIAGGGDLLLAGEPGKQAFLDPILQPLGVQMKEGMLVQQSKDFSPELIQAFITPAAAAITPRLLKDAKDSIVVSMRGAAALTFNTGGPFTIRPFLVTDGKNAWNKKVKPTEDEIESSESEPSGTIIMSAGITGIPMSTEPSKHNNLPQLTFSPAAGDEGGSMATVLGLTRTINGRQQRIVVAGDADFLSNAELGRTNLKTANFDFSTALFSWFSNGEFPIDTSRPDSKDTHLNLTNAGLTRLRVLLMGILPGILLILGTVLLIRRKRK